MKKKTVNKLRINLNIDAINPHQIPGAFIRRKSKRIASNVHQHHLNV